jgi:hypothetical protein
MWIHVAQDVDKRRALVNMALHFGYHEGGDERTSLHFLSRLVYIHCYCL